MIGISGLPARDKKSISELERIAKECGAITYPGFFYPIACKFNSLEDLEKFSLQIQKMKTRKEVAALINEQLKRDLYERKPGHAWHYGKVELRELLDFIYEGEPESEEEKIK